MTNKEREEKLRKLMPDWEAIAEKLTDFTFSFANAIDQQMRWVIALESVSRMYFELAASVIGEEAIRKALRAKMDELKRITKEKEEEGS